VYVGFQPELLSSWLHREDNFLASVTIQCWKLHLQMFVCGHALATVKNNFRRHGHSFYEIYCGLY
jgi:hypothetical protein